MKNIYILFGGKSTEHEISILTAKSVINNLDRKKYKIFPIFVNKKGAWNFLGENLENIKDEKELIKDEKMDVFKSISSFFENHFIKENSIFFPAMHGTFSEDGTIQGFFDIMDVTYVGNNVLSSAICMDKAIANDVFYANNIDQPKYYLITKYEFLKNKDLVIKNILEKIGEKSFIKPCNAGSSVGVSKVLSFLEIEKALLEAFKYDNRVLAEEMIIGDELQVLVTGNHILSATLPGGVRVSRDFFDYEAKYLDKTTDHIIPWDDLTQREIKEIRTLAKRAYDATSCKGLARVDIFVRAKDRKMLVNEINTIPGMTDVSMAPMMYIKTYNKTYGEFLDEIISLAIENKKEKDSLVTNRG